MLAIFNKFNGNSKLYKFYSYKILLTLTLKIYHIFSKQVIGFSERKCFNWRAFFCGKQVIQIGAQVIPTHLKLPLFKGIKASGWELLGRLQCALGIGLWVTTHNDNHRYDAVQSYLQGRESFKPPLRSLCCHLYLSGFESTMI